MITHMMLVIEKKTVFHFHCMCLQVELEGNVLKKMTTVREQVAPKNASKASLDEDLLSMVHELSQVWK